MASFDHILEAPAERWVCLEVFGHRQHFGRLTDVEQFGARFARVEILCPKGHLVDAPTYAGAAIFSITDLPGGEEEARRRTGSFGCVHPECRAAAPALPSHADGLDEASDFDHADHEEG